MKAMDQIWVHYKDTLDALEALIAKEINSEVPLINQVVHYVLRSGGKRVRPLLLAISAEMCGGADRSQTLVGGSMVEFVHTATLLHDDVLDGAEMRRGTSAARAVWGDHACILVGDYLYTIAACQTAAMGNAEVTDLFARACRRMSEGETLQLAHNGDFDLTEETYLRIIDYKTASLLSASCRLGGVIAGASEAEKEALARFGRNLGIAFQVADDTLDYTADRRQLGKPIGQDFREGRMTLPLLALLSRCAPEEKARIQARGREMADGAPDGLGEIVEGMRRHGAIAYAFRKAQDFADLAKADLSLFPDSVCRQSLITVADYVVSRDH